MTATNDSALALAGQLRSLPDADLAALLEAREFRSSGVKDFFDLADALFESDSIQHALGTLDRPTLAALAVLGGQAPMTEQDAAAELTANGVTPAGRPLEAARRLALVMHADQLYSVPPPVAAQLARWPSLGLPGLSELIAERPPAPLAPATGVEAGFTDRLSAENAFSTTIAVSELIAELHHESARELARGGIALPDGKRLAASMGIELDRVRGMLETAATAGLVALDAGRWMPAGDSETWLVSTSGERWAMLAGAWLDRLPPGIRAVLREQAGARWGERLEEYIAWLFPGGGQRMTERVHSYARDAHLLGITADHAPSTPGMALLTDGTAPAAVAMAAIFPEEVEKVYLQHDLSIVSPGPLAPRLDARLRSMSDVEGRALAAVYRVSTASMYRAMAMGETAQSLRAFLSEISLTGIPQPLEYLIAEAASRYGLVRVGTLDNGRTFIRSTDDALLRTLLVDHTLAPLGLGRAAHQLESRFDRELVFWSLTEARYPVAAENAAGDVVLLKRRQASRSVATPGGRALGLIDKLRLGSSTDEDVTGTAWLSRQLDVAIRAKLALTVTVQLQDGTTTDYQLEPASVAGGRLRARDRKADIERTLPLASVTAVGPAL